MATINPFQAPINYAVDVQSPFEAALGGFKLGAGVAEIEAAKQAREKAQAPKGRQTPRALPPLRGWGKKEARDPWAYAHGKVLPPRRG